MSRGASGLALLALSVFATWPALTHLNELLYVDDPFVSGWGLWWTADSLVHLRNPWWTRDVLAPHGTYLAFHALVPLAGVVLAPAIKLVGPGLTLNLLKIVLPIGATLSARWLARVAGLAAPAAWIAGALYGFSTIVVWRAIFHLNFGVGLALLPLATAFLVSYDRSRRVRDALAAGTVVGLELLVDPTTALFAALTAAAYGAVAMAARREWWLWVRGALLATGAAALVGLPQLAMTARAASNDGYDPNMQVLASTWVGANTNLATMASPGAVRGVVPGRLEELAYKNPWGEATPAYGWGALGLGLMLFGMLVLGRRRRIRLEVPARFLIWAALVFAGASVLALGPELTLAGSPATPLPVERYGQRLSGVMPYTWLTYLPVFGDVRVPSRFTMPGMLALAMLAGCGAAAASRAGRAGRVVAAALLAFAVLEAGFPDGGIAGRWVPMTRAALYAPIKADRSDRVVVDVPLAFLGATNGAGASPGAVEPMFRAAEHGHPVAEAYITRLTGAQVRTLVAHPLYSSLIALQSGANDGAAPPAGDVAAAARDAEAIAVGWVVVWPQAERQVLPFLERAGFERVHAVDGILLYRRVTGGGRGAR